MRSITMTVSPESREQRGLRPSAARIRDHFEARRRLRKGLCLMNAGLFDDAVRELFRAQQLGCADRNWSAPMVQALHAAGRHDEAAETAAKHHAAHPDDVAGLVRLALTQWRNHAAHRAVDTLRAGIANHPECADLHYQLGVMLAALDETEEAELRFVQALAIHKDHPDALVALALSRGAAGDLAEAVRRLRHAQRMNPADARTALLLAQAARAAAAAGIEVDLQTDMPQTDDSDHNAALAFLGRTIETEPDFVDAFLSLTSAEVDGELFDVLAATLRQAIERNPRRAPLHFQRSRVLQRLGRADEAVAAAERAVEIDARHVQALILLANLYRQTDRFADARRRLEECVLLGAEYPDVYCLLGNLYRDDGQLQRARWAYEQALRINRQYTAAREALAALAA